jgi:hypothetical protein
VHPKWFLSLWYVLHKPCTYLASGSALSRNGLNWASTWASQPRSAIGYVPIAFLSMWYVWCKLCTYLASRIALPPNGLNPLEPRHLEVPTCVSKTISEATLCLAKTVHLSCTDTYTISKRTEQDSTWPTSPRSCIWCVQNIFWANGTFGANRAPILRQDQHYLETHWNELPLEPHNVGVPSGASKMISELMVLLAQGINLSCTDTNTVSKRTETRFHMTHVTQEFH